MARVTENWKQLDLQGGGLQSANLKLAALLKRRPVAYALVALYPLGLHRDYLDDRRGGWLYRTGTGIAFLAWLAGEPMVIWITAILLTAGALRDLLHTEASVATINKALRMRVYLAQTEGPPPGFTGRAEETPAEPAAAAGRVPSFAEQERLLAELSRRREEKSK